MGRAMCGIHKAEPGWHSAQARRWQRTEVQRREQRGESSVESGAEGTARSGCRGQTHGK
jgi:hypothetical protein